MFGCTPKIQVKYSSATQLGEGSAHQPGRGDQEDHEALQYSGFVKAHLPRAEVAQAPETRERMDTTQQLPRQRVLTAAQIISLSDIFISPLEDM